MRRIAMNMESAMKERGFCVLSWALLLRAPSEASDLVRAQGADSWAAPFQPKKLPRRDRSRWGRAGDSRQQS